MTDFNNTNPSGVQFEEEALHTRIPMTPVSQSNIAALLIKYSGGIIKTERQVFFIALVLAIILLSFGVHTVRKNSHEPEAGVVPENQIVPS
jgi:hypothetical protein